MGASPDRLTPAQKDAIYELKRRGKSGREVASVVRAGYAELEPFSVSPAHANEIYRLMAEAKGELYTTQIEGLSTDGALDKLQARLLRLAEREIARLETSAGRGKLDGAKVAKLATALERIHKLSEARAVPPPGKDRDKKSDANEPRASDFASQLAEDADAGEAPIGDVVIGPNGSVPGPKPNGGGEGHASNAAPDPSSPGSVADPERLGLAREAHG